MRFFTKISPDESQGSFATVISAGEHTKVCVLTAMFNTRERPSKILRMCTEVDGSMHMNPIEDRVECLVKELEAQGFVENTERMFSEKLSVNVDKEVLELIKS